MNLTRGMAEVIAQGIACGYDSGQGHEDDIAEYRIWQTIGIFFPDILDTYKYVPLAQKARLCPLSPST